VTYNSDGTRAFTLGASGDFATLADIVWGHPVGITPGDTLDGGGQVFAENFAINASGLSGSEINIKRIQAQAISDDVNSYLVVAYCISANSSSSGVAISGANNAFYNLTVYGATTYGFDVNEDTTIDNSVAYGSGVSDANIAGGKIVTGTHNIYDGTDPIFRSTSDYRLRAGSPAINAGVDVGLTTDYLGNPIIGLPDIGAYENIPVGGNMTNSTDMYL